ncbi:hypothetical protein [Bauldia litoralis]|uniref:Uncharacterized protein n=1 Tax=Bauldia litoralis TaxID=665467 RepID=A0A1G6D1W7_9HYPH|nr:hypothetical protein [Bauldia litoralis]SDB39110.1 hypothetical protein SAMN02982931_02901 [Bauldia litoralis]
MVFPPKDEVQAILADFEDRMAAILEGAWQEWLDVPRRAALSPRSRASMVFDFIRRRALEEFDSDPEIRAIPKGQTVHFLFHDKVLLRFKKANTRGLGSNIETQAVIEFIDPQMSLLPLPPIYHVEGCYHLDKLATKMALLTVAARQRNKRLWTYEMRRSADTRVMPLPMAPRHDGGLPEVRVRKSAEKPAKQGE